MSRGLYRTNVFLLLPIALAFACAGCASNGQGPVSDAPITGRQITQNMPSPDYTVFYWNALRACLQTGRSEWECKSGEYRFVRDALAIEAELDAQRRQRRNDQLARAELDTNIGATEQTLELALAADTPRQLRSVMLDWRPESESLEIPHHLHWQVSGTEAEGSVTTE